MLRIAVAALLGAATVLGFSPFGLALLPPLLLAGLFLLISRATPRQAGWAGFGFGLGLFGMGASWVFIALNAFGEMPLAIAAVSTLGFCVYLALFPAFVGWFAARATPPRSVRRLLLAAALFALADWVRSWLFSGFPWLSLGYSQVDTWLGGFAPIGGVFLVGLAVALSAAALARLADFSAANRREAIVAAVALVALWTAGLALQQIEWSTPTGAPLRVSLVQGNIAQERKFEADYRERTLQIYRDLVEQSRGRLIVLPESALPMFADEVPADYLAELRALARRNGGDLLVGVFFFEPADRKGDEDRYFNSVMSLGPGQSQIYRKYHLVPFGETIPAKPIFGWFFRSFLNIPLADQTPGTEHPVPFDVAGERVAVNICYEDAFGGELIRQLPQATLLVNVTNDAWYGHSFAAQQHSQMGAMRALETSRPMLRATNTGITSVIDHRGVERMSLPWFTTGILEASIAGRTGATPYVRFGDLLAVAACGLLLLGIALRGIAVERE